MMIPTQGERKKKDVAKVVAVVGVLLVMAGLLSVANQSGWNSINSKPSTSMRAEVTNQALANTLANRGAPIIYLFADDRNRPSSVEHFFGVTRLMNADGSVRSSSPNSAIVGSAPSDCYFEMTNPPTKQNPIPTGQTTSNGVSTAPLYARVFDDGSYYRVTYALFYPVSGYQIFRISYNQNGKTKKRNYEWAEMAFHEGDWEHVQVWLRKSWPYTIVGIAPGQHGKEYYYSASEINFESGRPVLYSAWNTHAMYTTKGQFAEESIPAGFLTEGAVNWIKIIDTTQTDQTTKEYAAAPDRNNPPKINGGSTVVVTNANEASMAWLNFDGRWGPDVKNSMENPPSFGPSNVERFLRDIKNLVNDWGKSLYPDYFTAKGPKAPETQNWWADKIPNDAPSGQTA